MISHTNYDVVDCDPLAGHWVAKRLLNEPIVHAGLHPSIGENIQGPSLIRVPEWVRDPLGRYYLYFADHKGRYIRLAYADCLTGPWQIHEPGSLRLEQSLFPTEQIKPPKDSGAAEATANLPKLLHSRAYEASTPHIASPDVHVTEDVKRIYMYFHGLEAYATQNTRLATSEDGIHFVAEEPILCRSYLRVVSYRQKYLGLVMPGTMFVMNHARGPFDDSVCWFTPNARHHAVLVNYDRAFIFWTQVGDAPERVKVSVVELADTLNDMQVNHLNEILRPELEWEGAFAPNHPSVRSVAYGRVNQLRDPCIFVEEDKVYLLYAGGGESAIGIAELTWETIS